MDFWVKCVKEILGNTPIFGLAGNKKDLFQVEEVDEEEGENKAKEINALFKLTSAKTGQGINDFMQSLLEEYVKSVENISKTKSIDTIEDEERRGTKLDGSIHILRPKKRKCC